MNNYFRSGRYNRKLEQAYLYDKKKELKDARKDKNNTQERPSKEKAATEL